MIDHQSYLDKIKQTESGAAIEINSFHSILLKDNTNVNTKSNNNNNQIKRNNFSNSNLRNIKYANSSSRGADSCLGICFTTCKYSFLKWIILVLFIVFVFQLVTGINCYAIIKKQYSKPAAIYQYRADASRLENLPTHTTHASISNTSTTSTTTTTASKIESEKSHLNNTVESGIKVPNNFKRLVDVENEINENETYWDRVSDAQLEFRDTFTEFKRAFASMLEEVSYDFCDLPKLNGPLNLTFNFTDFNSSQIPDLYQMYYERSFITHGFTDNNFNNLTSEENFMIIEPTISIDVKLGGVWKPRFCHQEHKVIVIIPYRNRFAHLAALLPLLHTLLQRQLINYRIVVTEQFGNATFNKGRIMNAAYLEAKKLFPDAKCVIFHDVDLLPEDDRIMYTCPKKPRHLSVAIDKFNYVLPYYDLVGGVFAISFEHFEMVNGYSVSYFGWGGEDDDLAKRLSLKKLPITRPRNEIARYKMVRHQGRTLNPNRHQALRRTKKMFQKDGLNSVEYRLISVTYYYAFTHFMFDIGNA